MSKAKIETLTLAECAVSKSKELWVLNTTHGELSANIVITGKTGSGEGVTLVVPLTFIAIRLTDAVDKKSLLSFLSFRRAVEMEGISIISEETAEKINSHPRAKAEMERVRLEQRSAGGKSIAGTLESAYKNARENQVKESFAPVHREERVSGRSSLESLSDADIDSDALPSGVSSRIFILMNEAAADVGTDGAEEALTDKIRVIAKSLTALDWVFVVEKAKRFGYTDLAKKAKKQANK